MKWSDRIRYLLTFGEMGGKWDWKTRADVVEPKPEAKPQGPVFSKTALAFVQENCTKLKQVVILAPNRETAMDFKLDCIAAGFLEKQIPVSVLSGGLDDHDLQVGLAQLEMGEPGVWIMTPEVRCRKSMHIDGAFCALTKLDDGQVSRVLLMYTGSGPFINGPSWNSFDREGMRLKLGNVIHTPKSFFKEAVGFALRKMGESPEERTEQVILVSSRLDDLHHARAFLEDKGIPCYLTTAVVPPNQRNAIQSKLEAGMPGVYLMTRHLLNGMRAVSDAHLFSMQEVRHPDVLAVMRSAVRGNGTVINGDVVIRMPSEPRSPTRFEMGMRAPAVEFQGDVVVLKQIEPYMISLVSSGPDIQPIGKTVREQDRESRMNRQMKFLVEHAEREVRLKRIKVLETELAYMKHRDARGQLVVPRMMVEFEFSASAYTGAETFPLPDYIQWLEQELQRLRALN